MAKISESLGKKRHPEPNKKAPLGQGGRFEAVVQALMRKGMSRERASAIAATQGRKKYGAKQMARWAAKGR